MSKRVLIVDDEENIREMIRLALEASGYEVGEAESGLEAFAIIDADDSWNAVLLDQKMPGMAGIEVLRRLKVILPSASVIMMTAFASIGLAVEAMKLSASDFVRKPMTPEILRNAIAAALAKEVEQRTSNTKYVGQARPEQITLNGFTILSSLTTHSEATPNENERVFLVKGPDGDQHVIVIEIAPEAILEVEKVTTALPLPNAFWTEQAEQFLSDFLWNDGTAPATGRLTLKGIERETLQRALQKEVVNEQAHFDH